ncbi:Uncharacterized response regulatory protein SA0215 [[Eubacterium] contortum]|uniref:Stage 0 sporulation protein A homolog n=1 Tax=Faecalicatena contorta TaxID=39482 RepID=A0A174GBR5_9FIRM|nr:response regulator [Faecalicatena contorta]CUO58340.1 Uncharacterized response regulatory protein SA0215 [[Eubacterium] contortum] [Faecalicatena contorta]
MDIKLLIVDDEVQIRKGIEKGIPWKELGISKVQSAPNGVAALEIIRAERTDILITDIRMPGMDGLELARKAKTVQENMHIIILSGFSEFDYAKQAISIGVKDYLLKPIKVRELTDNVISIVKKMQEEVKVKSLSDRIQTEERIAQYLLMKKSDEAEFMSLIQSLSGLANEDKVMCVLLESDTKDMKEDRDLRERILESFEKEAAAHKSDFVIRLPRHILYAARMDLCRSRAQVIRQIEEIVHGVNKISKEKKLPTVSAAVSENSLLSEMPDAVDVCIHLLNKRLYMGTGVVVPEGEETVEENISFYIDNEEQIRKYILKFQYEEIQSCIGKHFQKMKEMRVSSYDLVKGVCLTLKQLLFHGIRETGLDAEQVLEKNKNFMLEVPDLLTIEEYENWICNLYYLILKGVAEHTKRNVSNTIVAAAAYISTHYHEELTVEELSAYVNKSKNYFSYLFKKEMKISFTEYLNRYRIDQACILLDTTLDLAGEIGQRVGFKDEKYFSTVFKKMMGCTPSQYRKNRGTEKES